MKKKWLSLLLLFSISISSQAQQIDSSTISIIIEKGNKQIITAIDGQTKVLKDYVSSVSSPPKRLILEPNNFMAHTIVFSPIIIFLLILFGVNKKLTNDKVKLSDFLVDKETEVALKKEEANITIANAKATIATANAIEANVKAYVAANIAPPDIPETPAANPKNEGDNSKEQSTSRLIAFISGIISIGLAVCITSFYFYRSFLGDTNVSLDELTKVIYGLGLGLIPYGFNKIASAIK